MSGEYSESVRKDTANRKADEKQINDWSGKRVVLPRGTTLPTTGFPGEVFVLIRSGQKDQVYIYDDGLSKFATVG